MKANVSCSSGESSRSPGLSRVGAVAALRGSRMRLKFPSHITILNDMQLLVFKL